ncbi:MAG: hypothetical protein Q8P39_02125 [Candidatus Yanofskybacteria bacterium]|nr:hypothetical protein [Candidatus Yanofskybacteria bacterium]
MDISIAFAIFITSFAGLAYIIGRKLSFLRVLPRNDEAMERMKQELRERLKNSAPARYLHSPDLLLQTILSKTRIISLKAETKTSKWLEQLRQKSQKERTELEGDGYWEQLKGKKKGGKKKKEDTPA